MAREDEREGRQPNIGLVDGGQGLLRLERAMGVVMRQTQGKKHSTRG